MYTRINYQNECPDTIEGLNFDKFDKTSAIVYYKRERNISATCRLIFDSKNSFKEESLGLFSCKLLTKVALSKFNLLISVL